MKYKTSELTGDLLNLAVHKAREVAGYETLTAGFPELIAYSTSWGIGGPIIDRENIQLSDYGTSRQAEIRDDSKPWVSQRGETLLIAAMRAFVAHKLGEEVEL